MKELNISLYEVLCGKYSPEQAIQKTCMDRLNILPTKPDSVGIEIEYINEENREYVLKNILTPIKKNYDYILLDAPPSLGLLTLNALTCADSILIPVQCQFYAIEGLSLLLNTIKLTRKKFNPSLSIEGILLTMFDPCTRLSQQMVNMIKHYFKDKVFNTLISINVRLAEAPSFGKPVIEHDPESSGAKNYMALVHEVIARNDKNRSKE